MKGWALVCCLALSGAAAAEPALLEQPQEDGSGDRVGRVAAELGAAILAAALPNLLWVPFAFAGGGGSPSALGPLLLVVALSLEPIAIPTGVWLVHRKMGGQGYWATAFGGTMLGLLLGGAVLGFYAWGTDFKVPAHYTALAVTGAGFIAVAAAVFAIELHHDSVNASLAPLPGGAMGAVSFRF